MVCLIEDGQNLSFSVDGWWNLPNSSLPAPPLKHPEKRRREERKRRSTDRSQAEDTRGSVIDLEFREERAERDPHQYLSVITGSSSWNAARVDSWFLEDSSVALKATAHLTLDGNRKEHRFHDHSFFSQNAVHLITFRVHFITFWLKTTSNATCDIRIILYILIFFYPFQFGLVLFICEV